MEEVACILDTASSQSFDGQVSAGQSEIAVATRTRVVDSRVPKTVRLVWRSPGRGLMHFLMRHYEDNRAKVFRITLRSTQQEVRVRYAAPTTRGQNAGLHSGTITATLEQVLT